MVTNAELARRASDDPRAAELRDQALALDRRVATITILNADDYREAGEFVLAAKGKAKELEAKRMEMTRPLDDSKRAIMAWFDEPITKLLNAAKAVAATMKGWKDAEERCEAERRRLAQEEANRRAREERERLEREAQERDREARERAAALEADARAAATFGDAEAAERLAGEAREEVERGANEAVGLAMQALEVKAAPVPETAPAVPKGYGSQVRTLYRFKVVDAALVPREYLMVDEAALGALARREKAACRVPGVVFWSE